MKIICKIKRQQTDRDGNVVSEGSKIELGANRERVYLFKPDKNGDHVCDVTDARDIAALIKIDEGFEIHPGELSRGPEQKPVEPEPVKGKAKGV